MFVCRVCLTFKDNLFPIQDYVEQFFHITGLQIERDALMCPACIRQLDEAYNFRQQALKADRFLKRRKAESQQQLSGLSVVKEEPLDEIEFELRVDKSTSKLSNDRLKEASQEDNTDLFDDSKDKGDYEIFSACEKREKGSRGSSKQRKRNYKRDTENAISGCPYCFFYVKDRKTLLQHINEHIGKYILIMLLIMIMIFI